MEVRVQGPSVDLHSGVYGGAVMNPATAAARLVASLHDADGRVAIPGFYDTVQSLADWERAAAAECPVTDADILAQTGSPALFGEAGYSAVERIGANADGIEEGIAVLFWPEFQEIGGRLKRTAHDHEGFRFVVGDNDGHRPIVSVFHHEPPSGVPLHTIRDGEKSSIPRSAQIPCLTVRTRTYSERV